MLPRGVGGNSRNNSLTETNEDNSHRNIKMNFWSCLILVACVFSVQGQEMKECSKHGTKVNPGKSCADIMKQTCMETTEDGIYWIALTRGTMEQQRPFPVYCDMKTGGWTMVFKAIAGVPGRMARYWKMPYPTFEYSTEALNKMNSFKHHYKNRIIQNWDKFTPKEARVVMYTESKEMMVLRFEIDRQSDNMTWFSQKNLREAPWEDILTENKNYFALEGHCPGDDKLKCRDFHINSYFNTCDDTKGWLSVGNARECRWERRFLENAFVYSNQATMANYNQYAKISSAEVFAVYLR